MFLPHDHGGLGVNKVILRILHHKNHFLVKMLNHNVKEFSFIATGSLKLDMKKRDVTFLASKEE